jgi:pyridinium-3,5-bisthiocarboxylic acid mononucleotide nickel chelatase
MAKILYYDCFAGISGDMNAAALLDAGVEEGYVRNELSKLPIAGEFTLAIQNEKKMGIAGKRFIVHAEKTQHGRGLKEIEQIIGEAGYSAAVESTALRIFRCLGEAEAAVHGTDIDTVHFHEVGAVDSIVDIVSAAICVDALGVDRIISRPPELGGGFVQTAHGLLPVPAPATLEILHGVPVKKGGVDFEATTPTGAAILSVTANRFAETFAFVPRRVGYGFGSREAQIPNALRVVLGEEVNAPVRKEIQPVGDMRTGENIIVECTIDDMDPELYDNCMDRLFQAGALDVYVTPVVMKKNRPGTALRVLCGSEDREKIVRTVLTHTTTIGVRVMKVDKYMLRREEKTVVTKYGTVRIKTSFLDGKTLHSKPEYDDCKKAAEKHGVSIREARRAAMRAAENEGIE